MSESPNALLETEHPVFDVMVSLPLGVSVEDVRRIALQRGELSERHIEQLTRALLAGPRVKVGDHVLKEQAEKIRLQFARLSLAVAIVPQLSVEVKRASPQDGLFLCRACNTRVDLPETRKCPNCHMFVDRITDEWLLRKKILEQERAKLEFQRSREDKDMKKAHQKSLEDAIRARIREELEEEFGLTRNPSLFAGSQGALRVAGLMGAVLAAFVGGSVVPPGTLPWSQSAQSAASTAAGPAPTDVDKILAKVGAAKAPAAAGATDAAAPQAAEVTGDADLDDPMLQALTAGKKLGGPGITLEQAVAASKALVPGFSARLQTSKSVARQEPQEPP